MPAPLPLVMLIALALKEASDIGTTAVVTIQSGRKFAAFKNVRGGSVGIEGGSVTVTIGEGRFVLPLEEAAAQGGWGGGGARKKPVPAKSRIEEWIESPLGVLTAPRAGKELAKGLMWLGRPRPGEDAAAAVEAPDLDARPFTAREYLKAIEEGKFKRGAAAAASERSLAVLEQAHEFKLGLLDAQIEREKIAAQVDVARMQIVARLEEQRRDLISKFALQREELANRLQLQAEKAEAELVSQRERFGLQEGLNVAEREWKTVEGARDRKWRADTQREQSELAQYRLNLNSDLAVGRAVDAAVKLGEVLKRAGLQPAGLVSFGQAFAGR